MSAGIFNMEALSKRKDKTSTDGVIYYGTARIGALESEKAWQIAKITLDDEGDWIKQENAENLEAWTDRTSLTYK